MLEEVKVAEEKTLTVTYLGGLTGDMYSTPEYSMDKGEEYDVPEKEAKRLHEDFPTFFTIEGFESPKAKKGSKKDDEGDGGSEGENEDDKKSDEKSAGKKSKK